MNICSKSNFPRGRGGVSLCNNAAILVQEAFRVLSFQHFHYLYEVLPTALSSHEMTPHLFNHFTFPLSTYEIVSFVKNYANEPKFNDLVFSSDYSSKSLS